MLRSSDSTPLIPRRTVLQALALAGGGSLPHAWAKLPSDEPLAPSAAAWRALSRVGYGPTRTLAAQLHDLPSARDWARQQVDAALAASRLPPRIAPSLAGFNAPLPVLFAGARKEREAILQARAEDPAMGEAGRAPAQVPFRDQFLRDQGPRYFNRLTLQQAAAWRLHSASSPDIENPLLARLTEFWFNHFNVYVGKGTVRAFAGHYAVHVARAHALGRFEDLLLASARHPAMLFYLDQAQSMAEGTRGLDGTLRGLNENYAREVMELHTLGVDGGYTQADVRELARILTGWTVAPYAASGFRFAPRLHDEGPKRVLGQEFGSGRSSGRGEQEGVQALRMLARHPATARRVCTRLAQCFVSDQPPAALVHDLAGVFLDSGGDLAAVMRSLLAAPEFWADSSQLFKTPLDFAVSALAAVQDGEGPASVDQGPDRARIALCLAFLNDAGQPMHGWQTPDGYRFDRAAWQVPEALTRRADFALTLARQMPEPDWLRPFLSAATLERIVQSPPSLRAGLMLASPEFMLK